MHRELERFRIEPERESQARLRIEVDEQDFLAHLGPGSAEGCHCRGLGDATFWLATAIVRVTTMIPNVSREASDLYCAAHEYAALRCPAAWRGTN